MLMPHSRRWTPPRGIGTLARSLIAAASAWSLCGDRDGDGAEATAKAVSAAGDDAPAAAGDQAATAFADGAAGAGPAGARAESDVGAARRNRRGGHVGQGPWRGLAGGR